MNREEEEQNVYYAMHYARHFGDDDERINNYGKAYGLARELCLSPIERKLLPWLLMSKVIGIFPHPGPYDIQKLTYCEPDSWLAKRELMGDCDGMIGCQVKVMGHKVDFAIAAKLFEATHTILIECDGHEFHNAKKEWVARDRDLDRKYQTAGYTICRFTGSEIFRSPITCAETVRKIMARKIADGLFSHDETYRRQREVDFNGGERP